MCRISTPSNPIRAASSMHRSIGTFSFSKCQKEYVETPTRFFRLGGVAGESAAEAAAGPAAPTSAAAATSDDPATNSRRVGLISLLQKEQTADERRSAQVNYLFLNLRAYRSSAVVLSRVK